jgi:hypothetical protein
MEEWKEAGRNSDGKADVGKVRAGLLYTQFGDNLMEVAEVLTFGAAKYPKPPLDDSWRDVPGGFNRYQDALYRHIHAYLTKGEVLDPESGRHHLAHAICNILFLMELENVQS